MSKGTPFLFGADMNEKFKRAHMRAAEVYAVESHATRRKVGCVVVKDDTVIAIGVNRTPPGWSNIYVEQIREE